MAVAIVFRPEALDDLSAAHQWYQGKQPGLGAEFMSAIEQKIAQITVAPQRYQKIRGPIRRAITKHFPYGIFFVESGDRVTVVAVMHQARHPRHWRAASITERLNAVYAVESSALYNPADEHF